MDDLPSRVAVLEQIARTTLATLDRLETRFDRIEAKLDLFESLEAHLPRRMAARAVGHEMRTAFMIHDRFGHELPRKMSSAGQATKNMKIMEGR